MRQAQTLNEAQFRRVLHYCRSRRHSLRDTTIFMISFYAGLRAKEIAALTLGNVFDEAGTVREQFILGTEQSKGGQRRTVYLNQRLRKALAEYGASKQLKNLDLPLFASQRAVTSPPTQCVSCFWTSTNPVALRMHQAIRDAGPTSLVWPTRG